MIKTNELRIGNFVSINNGFEMLVHSIFQNDTVYLDFIPPLVNEGDIWEEDFKDINPIPLTEEWFLKFGFKKNKHENLILNLELDRKLEIIETKEGFYIELVQLPELSCEDIQFIVLRKIEYVHQLQNLYFALTGEDIIFSTEP